jgi:hypothetical protein
MTSGDGVVQGMPTFFGRTPLWEPNLSLGYPLFADPNQAFWYPLLHIVRNVAGGFNTYAILPFIIVATGTFGFARRVTGSIAGSWIAGSTVALGGFMIAHQGHLMLIHPACWAPWLLWAIDALRERSRAAVVVGGAIAFAFAATAGSQQPLVYLALVGILLAIAQSPADGTRRSAFFRDVTMMFALGAGLSAIALLPAAELTLHTARAHQTLAEYAVFSTAPIEFAIRMFFPYFFGPTSVSLYSQSHTQVGAFTETTNYAGIATLMLGILALTDRVRRREVLFWLAVAVGSAWLSMGNALLAASITYRIPIYGVFRIPGRHAFEFTFAVAMLAAYGVASIERGRVAWPRLAGAVAAVAVCAGSVASILALRGNDIRTALQSTGSTQMVALSPSANPAISVPLAVVAVSGLALILWCRIPDRRIGAAIGIIAVAGDLATFASASYWRDGGASAAVLQPPALARAFQALERRREGRLINLAFDAPAQSVAPNLTALYAIPNAAAYVSLENREVRDLLDVAPEAILTPVRAADPEDAAPDIAGIRYYLIPPALGQRVPIAQEFATSPLDGFVGSLGIAPERDVTFALDAPASGTTLDLISALGVSVAIPNGAHVADAVLHARDRDYRIPIVAGRDTSESAYDRPDVRPRVKHARATIFGGTPDARLYIARLPIPTTEPIDRVTIAWVYPAVDGGALSIVHLALADRQHGIARAFDVRARFSQRPRWTTALLPFGAAGDVIAENHFAFPHAWVADRDRPMHAADQLYAIRHANASDARAIDLHHVVLTSDPIALDASSGRDRVTTASREPVSESYDVACTGRCMLVTGDLFYPGWEATVDGKSEPLLRVDYAFRGIVVQGGRHRVVLTFQPPSLIAGAIVALLSAMCCALLILRRPVRAA